MAKGFKLSNAVMCASGLVCELCVNTAEKVEQAPPHLLALFV